MIGNAMLGEYEQYSHAPSSKLVYNLHTLVFLGIVRRQGSCKTLRSKHHQTLPFSGTFPAVHQEVPLPQGAAAEVQLCQSLWGFYHLFPQGFTAPETGWEREVCAHTSSQLSRR